MNNQLSTIDQSVVSPLFARAKEIYAEILECESSMFEMRDLLLKGAWQLGKILSEMKEEIGHGKWLFWLGGHWPQLGERNAQRCMAFHRDNANVRLAGSNPRNSSDFSVESVRKFMWGYIPEKERPQLSGDGPVTRAAHYLGFVNQFSKFDRQLAMGRATFDLPLFQRELAPTIRRIAELGGREWMMELLTAD